VQSCTDPLGSALHLFKAPRQHKGPPQCSGSGNLRRELRAHCKWLMEQGCMRGGQTWSSFRQTYPKLHRVMGRIALLGLAAGTLAILPFFRVLGDKGYGPRAHWYLAVNLIVGAYIAARGWLAIRRYDVPAHRRWMMRLSGWMWGTFLGIRLMLIFGVLGSKIFFPGHALRLSILWNVSNWVAPFLGIAVGDALARRWLRSQKAS
jgi:hypothetical protein